MEGDGILAWRGEKNVIFPLIFFSFFKNAIYDRWAIEIEGSQVNRACRWTGGIAMKMVVGMAAVCDY